MYIKNCHDSRLTKACRPFKGYRNLIDKASKSATFHILTVMCHSHKLIEDEEMRRIDGNSN